MTTPPQLDLLDPAFYADPYALYAELRQHHPVIWDDTNELWGVFRYDDVVDVERRREDFISSGNEKGGYRPNIPADASIIGMDDPAHTIRRTLVARRFTPKAVGLLEPLIRSSAIRLIDQALAHGEPIEVVSELSAPLPAIVIQTLLGFDDDMLPSLQSWATRTIALGGGPRAYNDDGMNAFFEFTAACVALYEERKAAPPKDDLLGLWIETEKTGLRDGTPFGLDEIVSDCLLLLDGGAETTRTVIGRSLMELAERPDAWQQLKAGADLNVAVDEFVRWSTPVHNMCRIAPKETTIGDTTIGAGQQVMMMYGSANRDPEHFDDPEVFDITREKNPHVSFGFGTHFCLGASLARFELKIFFEEFLARVDSLTVAEPTVEHATAFVRGITSGKISVDVAST